ncbi:hypothetical protein ID866_10549 [Astraeus odoratus]|nr:hypothetical protein ID866_10549 [Astraeus odoratus]
MAREQAINTLNQQWAEMHVPPADHGMDGANAQDNGPQQLLPQGAHAGDQDPPLQQPQPPPPAPPNPPQDPLPLPPIEETPPRGEGAITFNPAAKVASTLQTRPSDYALKWIEAFKHVPMWYFTREGLQEAAQTVRQSDKNEMLAIMQAAEGNPDHQLSFVDYMYAKNCFLIAIKNTKWGNEAADAFNWFFHNLDNHPLWDEGAHGEHTLLLYTSCV